MRHLIIFSNRTKLCTFLLLVLSVYCSYLSAQNLSDSQQGHYESFSLEEALKNPESVYRLNLSNQELKVPDSIWTRFTHLEYLSLKNDHLKEIPEGIGLVTTLKVLDLSGNDFVSLPKSFVNLVNLEELFLNDEKSFVLKKSIPVLGALPNLKTLHIENDGLENLPPNFSKMRQLETLYLNNNKFTEVPRVVDDLQNLKLLDIQNNNLGSPAHQKVRSDHGFKINF